jgi:hypothetical protein
MERICVFCGSTSGAKPEYVQAAIQLGRTLASKNIELVYGGASDGVMGQMAKAALEAGGEVIGVVPKVLASQEVALTELADLRVVDSMAERIEVMVALSDGFIILPGGLGTINEFLEVLMRVGFYKYPKPVCLLNVCHYYDGLLNFLDHVVEQQFVGSDIRHLVLIGESPDALFEKIDRYQSSEAKEGEL